MGFEVFKDDYNLTNLELVSPLGQNFQMWITPRFRLHYVDDYYEKFTSRIVQNIAKNTDLFIDVGAHYGFFSLLVGSSNPKCRVISFEPEPNNFKVLKKNVSQNNLNNIKTVNQAVSNKIQRKKFNVSTASDNCSFIKHPSTPSLKQIEVSTVTLSEILVENPDSQILIKVDVDGHELAILEGIEGILEKSNNIQLILELNPKCTYLGGYTPEILLDKINGLGFDIYFIDDKENRIYRPNDGGIATWKDLIDQRSYGNLLCKKRTTSLNVLFFAHSSDLAGAERRLLELVKELSLDYGAICTVILPTHGAIEKYLHELGSATIIAPLYWWCSGIDGIDVNQQESLMDESFQWLIENDGLFRHINPDAIITNTITLPWGALAAFFLDCPHIWMINEYGEIDHSLKFFLPFSQVTKFICDASDKIVTCTEAVRKELFPDVEPNKIKTIYSYIDVSEKTYKNDEYYSTVYVNRSATKLIISGSLIKSKGQEDAVRAVNELVKNRKRNVELVLVGYSDPTYEAYLRNLIGVEGLDANIHILPFQENVLALIRKADIMLVCSRAEAFGRVNLEGMLLKKVVISSNTGGNPELIKDGITGLLYPPGDHVSLANQIERIIDDFEFSTELIENAYCFATKNFTKKRFGGEYHSMLMKTKKVEFIKKIDIQPFVINRFEGLLKKKNNELKEVTFKLTDLQEKLENIQIDQKENLIKTLSEQVVQCNQIIHNLTTQTDSEKNRYQDLLWRLAQSQEEILSYANSKSWKITRPLRKLIRFVRGKKSV